MKKGTATKAKYMTSITRKPREKKPEPQTMVCQFCGGRGYIELDKVGLLIKPCYNCEKGKAQAEMMGALEEMPDANIDNRTIPIDNGTQQPDNFTGSPDTS